jgi:hypothetical protein
MLQLSLASADSLGSAACVLLCNPTSQTQEFVPPPAPAGAAWLLRFETDTGSSPDQLLPERVWLPAQSLMLASAASLSAAL